MATNFPTSLDTLTNPSSGDQLNSPDHAGQHADANDAIEALEAKVGVNSSAVTTSLDYLVTQANAWGGSGFESGEYYGTPSNTNTATSTTRTTGQVSYTPFFCDRTQSFDRIAVRSGGALTGTVTVRLGIYNNTNKKPSTVLLDAGTVAATAVSTVYSITINQSLSAGWYWLAAVVTATTGTNSMWSLLDIASFNQSAPNAAFNGWNPAYTQSGVTGTFDTATSLSGNSSYSILVALRAV
jgi:hypothetical protein